MDEPDPRPETAPDPQTPEIAPVDSTPAPGTWACDLCGNPMMERHCKLVCTICGFMRDCSDP